MEALQTSQQGAALNELCEMKPFTPVRSMMLLYKMQGLELWAVMYQIPDRVGNFAKTVGFEMSGQ